MIKDYEMCKDCPYYYGELDECMDGEDGVPNNMIRKCSKGKLSMTKREAIEQLKVYKGLCSEINIKGIMAYDMAINALEKYRWIPCSKRMPEEHESFFTSFKGTDKWQDGFFEKESDKVIVTIEFPNGEREISTDETNDGIWVSNKLDMPYKVISWQPASTVYSDDEN